LKKFIVETKARGESGMTARNCAVILKELV
jgi:hypothetical protein